FPGHVGGRAAPLEAPRELAPAPRLAREKIDGRPPRRLGVERRPLAHRASGAPARRRHRFRKGLLSASACATDAVAAGGGTAFDAPASHVISPVERMPFTFKSKSSGLVAASRAVS